MKKIAIAGNTMPPAWLILMENGFSVRVEHQVGKNDGEEWWYAENGDFQIIAEDPVQLLGLFSILKTRGDNWKASDEDVDRFTRKFC